MVNVETARAQFSALSEFVWFHNRGVSLTPAEPERSTALVSFEVAADPNEITDRLRLQ